jgi:hypothetical protein
MALDPLICSPHSIAIMIMWVKGAIELGSMAAAGFAVDWLSTRKEQIQSKEADLFFEDGILNLLLIKNLKIDHT